EDQRVLDDLPNAEIVFVVKPEKTYINDQLWEQHWDIIFFAGHSETENDIGRIYINSKPNILENSLTTDELWYGLRKAVENGLQLAIFNSCDGLGLSKKINDFLIPQMIVMQDLVPDQVAQEFLKYFLKEYSQGKSLYLAVKEAKERLKNLNSQFPCANWLPVIFQHPQITPPKWDDLRSKSYGEYLAQFLQYQYQYKYIFTGGILIFFCILISYLLIPPKISDYFNQKGLEEIRKEDNTEANKYFNSSLKFNPNNTEAKANKSYIDLVDNIPELVIKSWANGEGRGNAAHCNSAGFAYYKRGNYDRAKDLLSETCLRLMEKTGDKRGIYTVLKNIAFVLIKQGYYAEADKISREAIALGIGPKEGVANCLLAESLEKQNIQNQETLYHWRYCLQNARDEFHEE
ncbi:MAG TPA: CHAT domain-containing protein, partial [Allocoleopsis sp.]